MNYRFHHAAIAEHLEHVAFYESQRQLAGLGADYLVEPTPSPCLLAGQIGE